MKWYTGIILLPDTTSSASAWHAGSGDQIEASLLRELQQKAPATLPLNLFRHKKLVLQARSEKKGAQVAGIPFLDSIAKHITGRLHLLLLSYCPLVELKAYAGSKKKLEPVSIPHFEANDGFSRFLDGTAAPCFLLLNHQGVILTTESGYYLTRENIREVARC